MWLLATLLNYANLAPNVNVYVAHLRTLLNCRFWFSRSGLGPEILLPGNAVAAVRRPRFEYSKALERQGVFYSSVIQLTCQPGTDEAVSLQG